MRHADRGGPSDGGGGRGDVAQMVERSLSMREVWGSIPHFSTGPLSGERGGFYTRLL